MRVSEAEVYRNGLGGGRDRRAGLAGGPSIGAMAGLPCGLATGESGAPLGVPYP